MKVLVIGLGLIGGSFAKDIKFHFKKSLIFGFDLNENNLNKSIELGIIDFVFNPNKKNNLDIIVIAVPVNNIPKLLPEILKTVNNNTLVFDVGSVKENICNSIKNHPNRKNFIACHPIAGTENSGPDAALLGLFKNKIMVICESELTNPTILLSGEKLFKKLGFELKYMPVKEHDLHVAYSSHTPHFCSYILAKTVMDKIENKEDILNLAGSGFSSAVRLAKSTPEMWNPIFFDNKESIIESLEIFIENMMKWKSLLENNKMNELKSELFKANSIREIIK